MSSKNWNLQGGQNVVVCPRDCPNRCADPNCHNAETCETWAAHEARQRAIYAERKKDVRREREHEREREGIRGMIEAKFCEGEISCEMKGDLAEVMAEFVCGTLSVLDAIASQNVDAANVVRKDLIAELAKFRPGQTGGQVVRRGLQ